MKRLIPLLLTLLLILTFPCGVAETASGENGYPVIVTDVKEINKYGSITLNISVEALQSQGYELTDVVIVSIAGKELVMPVVTEYAHVGIGMPLCRAKSGSEENTSYVQLAVNMGSLAEQVKLAEKKTVSDAPGYTWEYLVPTPAEVTISMLEKRGYADMYEVMKMDRSTAREDYPHLTDEEYANFRMVQTTGMGAWTLFRSSSPINPKMNRNREADEALNNAGIRTVLNLADTDSVMRGYEGYATSYYSQRDVIALGMDVQFASDSFKAKLVEGLTFMATHDGPYLIHCTEGKDRAGFTAALLECLMGASAEEVYADYMVSYYNYFGVKPGTEQYDAVLRYNMKQMLNTVFQVEDAASADLAQKAEEYLKSGGMSDETIEALKANLSRSWAE